MRFKALDKQIEVIDKARKGKWAKFVAGTGRAFIGCALYKKEVAECYHCVVQSITGGECDGTPEVEWGEAAFVSCDDCLDLGTSCSDRKGCPLRANTPEAKHHARREGKFLAAIQKGMEVMQRALAKIE